ncbi:MAG: hypothetical protein L0Z62_35120 [Gemmataceae bacterium]|nr:hypothetical protein [Gemmataceae bacterium]
MKTDDSRFADTPVQPTPAELMARYLQRQTEAHASGLAVLDLSGEVTPFDAGPVQPIDPRPAWDEAQAAARVLGPTGNGRSWPPPPSWAQLVAGHEPAAALACSLGNFPQLVRNLQMLMQKPNLSELRQTPTQPIAAPGLEEWASQAIQKKQFPEALLAAGALRLARQFDQAAELLQKLETTAPAEWKAALANEKAALAWHRGQWDEARAQWQALPASAPVLFNRGMAALFSNQPREARAALAEAVAQLPESGAWHHLGRLYLALAEMRGLA